MTRLRARGHVVAVAPADPLEGEQARRACHRGLFRACNEDEARRLDGCLERHRDVVFPVPQARVPQLADADSAATRVLMSERAWVAELQAWLRLSPRHPRHARDGLSAACLQLSGVEARAASWLLRPGMATLLSRIGVAGLLLDDRRKVLSASACVLVCAPATMDDFTLGRRWYRFWLALTAAGFAGVPMSAPVDVPALRAQVESLVSLPAGVRVCNAMRIGPAPAEFASRSARLEAAELCL
jgi:hypothetical protein